MSPKDLFGSSPGPELGTVKIDLPSSVDTGTFARYIPFNDKREIIVRRGPATGHHYGLIQNNRGVTISGREHQLVTYRNTLSPPVRRPGEPLLNDAEDSSHPVYDVLYLPDVEVMIQRSPASRGFTENEVAQILKAIHITPH